MSKDSIKRRGLLGYVIATSFMPTIVGCMSSMSEVFDASGLPPDVHRFNVSKRGERMRFRVDVRVHGLYILELEIPFRNESERKEALAVFGSFPSRGLGVSVPLKVSVFQISQSPETKQIFDSTIETNGIYAAGSGHYARRIWSFDLRPAPYDFQIECIQDTAEVAQFDTRVALIHRSDLVPVK